MRVLLVSVSLAAALWASSAWSRADGARTQAAAADRHSWYPGGTLHDVEISVWLAATPENQLATAADWALAFPTVQRALRASTQADAMFPYASALQRCVTQAAIDERADGHSPRTSDLAAACAVLLQWLRAQS
jgi:hypothetical protein